MEAIPHTYTILIIDDEPEKSLPLVPVLENHGHRVLFATSGTEGLAIIRESKPDIVICDLEMPDMGGYEVMEAISLQEGMPDLPFLLMNETWDETIWSRKVAGRYADTYLQKPLVPLEVAIFIKRITRSLEEDRLSEKD